MEKAIKKAIEGGWEEYAVPCNCRLMNDENGCLVGVHYKPWYQATSDPLFWQALGKALGWPAIAGELNSVAHRIFGTQWEYQWHMFIEHLAQDGDRDWFFNQLLK